MKKEEKIIFSILKKANKPLTTKEVEEIARREKECPDKPSHILNRLYWKGMIKREFKSGSWIWWV